MQHAYKIQARKKSRTGNLGPAILSVFPSIIVFFPLNFHEGSEIAQISKPCLTHHASSGNDNSAQSFDVGMGESTTRNQGELATRNQGETS